MADARCGLIGGPVDPVCATREPLQSPKVRSATSANAVPVSAPFRADHGIRGPIMQLPNGAGQSREEAQLLPMLIAVAPMPLGHFVSLPRLQSLSVPIDFSIMDERIHKPSDDNV